MANIKITVLGAGAWGCGISTVLAHNDYEVALFTNEEWITKEIRENKISPFLPNIKLSDRITPYTSLIEAAEDADFIFVVVPSKVILQVLENVRNVINKKTILVIASKGIDDENHMLSSEICEKILPNNPYAILAGPNFAVEVAQQKPTVTTIASKDKEVCDKVTRLMKNNYFKLVASNDVITTQITSAIKNIMAIGCGITDGLELGKNAQSALLMKGIEEIAALSKKLGGETKSLVSPAGFGDIFLTCSSTKSRNNSLGLRIGKGEKAAEILGKEETTYEGASAAKSILTFAKKHSIELPLCQAIHDIIYKDLSADQIKEIIYKSIL